MSVGQLPIIFIGVSVAVFVLSIVLRISGALLIISAVIGDYLASKLGFWVPTISVGGQDISDLLLFVAPIIAMAIFARRRHIKMTIFDHFLKVIGAMIVVLMAGKYSYELSQNISGSFLNDYTHQIDIFVSVSFVVALILLALSLHKSPKHHKK